VKASEIQRPGWYTMRGMSGDIQIVEARSSGGSGHWPDEIVFADESCSSVRWIMPECTFEPYQLSMDGWELIETEKRCGGVSTVYFRESTMSYRKRVELPRHVQAFLDAESSHGRAK